MREMRHPEAGIGQVVDEATFEAAGWADRGWELVDNAPEPPAPLVSVTDPADEAAAAELVATEPVADTVAEHEADDREPPTTNDLTPSDPTPTQALTGKES